MVKCYAGLVLQNKTHRLHACIYWLVVRTELHEDSFPQCNCLGNYIFKETVLFRLKIIEYLVFKRADTRQLKTQSLTYRGLHTSTFFLICIECHVQCISSIMLMYFEYLNGHVDLEYRIFSVISKIILFILQHQIVFSVYRNFVI